MRYIGAIGFLLSLPSFRALRAADDGSVESNRSVVIQRVHNGDSSALSELSKMSAPIAVPKLANLLRNSPKGSPRYENVREAMVQNPGTLNYLRERLATADLRGGVDEDAFEILGMLASAGSVAVVAPYVFSVVETTGRGDQLGGSTMISAAQALGNMEIPDAPTNKHPGTYQGAEILAWQKWAIRKGLVPSNSKLYIPQWIADSDNPALPPPTVKTPAVPDRSNQVVPLATPTKMSTLPRTTADKRTPAEEQRSTAWPWVIVATILSAVLVVWRLNRKSKFV